MVHMFSVPAGAAFSPYQNQPRMVYITNTELDDSGAVRAIHSHRETAEIALVYRGHGAHKIDNRIYDSEPGDLLLYNTDILHQDLSSTGDEPMCFYLCGIRGLQLEGRMPGVITSNPDDYLIKSGPYREFLFRGFEMLERSIQEHPPHTSPNISATAHGFLQSLLAIVSYLLDGRVSSGNGQTSEERSLAEDIRRYVDRNYTRNFSLSELAESLHVNRYYASHTFSAAFGMTIIRYRTLRRIGEAQSLLTDTDSSITYIASLIGYDDPNQFSQAFANIVGMPPSKYRELSVWPFRLNKK
ncbi:MAG: AraC family transcriptional regulator [Oscillibacter sp.]|nr:AraC family transcriptional regulator [Oscillibacter sp.]